MDNIVIFGASGGAIKVAKTLTNLGIEEEFKILMFYNIYDKVILGLSGYSCVMKS